MESKRNYDFTNTKLIIGNGFDLNCGIKSSYADFFNENSEYFKNCDMKKFVCDNYVNLTDYIDCEHNSFITNLPISPTLKKFENLNVWDLFFSLYRQKVNPNWCDIENAIKESFLKQIFVGGDYKYYITNLKYQWHKSHVDDSFRNLTFWGAVYEIINNEMNLYSRLNNQDIKAISVFISLIKHRTFKDEFNFYNYLLQELKKFEIGFGEYINYAASINRQIISTKQSSLIRKFPCKLTSIDSFNFDSLLCDMKNIPFRHINGAIKNPIFGFDYPGLTSADPRYIFTKTYRHMEMAINMPMEIPCNNFDNIVVYGHSLSSNDYNYFFPILDRLDMGSPATSEKKAIFAYSVYDSKRETEIKLDVLSGIIKLFEAYSEYKGLGKTSRLHDQLSVSGKILIYQVPEN